VKRKRIRTDARIRGKRIFFLRIFKTIEN